MKVGVQIELEKICTAILYLQVRIGRNTVDDRLFSGNARLGRCRGNRSTSQRPCNPVRTTLFTAVDILKGNTGTVAMYRMEVLCPLSSEDRC